ncbi:MAG: BREX system P-loop protein BrxC [Nitrospirae bacterium]|nr:BREX system P-loop protein BrxC [Nitrospirota bacterium]
MKIKEIFKKDIFRAINGVIKAEQKDEASIYQELDELVLTKELTGHLDRFFSVYADTVDDPISSDAAGKVGVWVSGFFGSGKSHFIKALYYLFANTSVEMGGKKKTALQFFEEKISDAMLSGTVKRVAGKDIDAILFNIDSKADQSRGREAILSVFLKVLNELQGYSPDHPHIAHMERYLDKKKQLGDFKREYAALTNEEWEDRRVDWHFNQDEIVKSLTRVLGQSEESCHRWIDHAETDFSLTVENFARWVKEYLDAKGPSHRLFFFVDEIGQFIGSDGHLMLSLQTIVENLGVVCAGRAWVVVTSQEDIDTVLGSLSNARTNDFSKIQGRFKTRISLSSSNTDEVIQRRLLEKKDDCVAGLKKLYTPNADILKNQLTFTSDTGMTLPSYNNPDEFVSNYPFVPYQFKLIQKVFETIRRAGATGLHLSRGERSMLDAFQFAAQQAASKDAGILVPIYWFYPSIESFLDTAVKRTIDQAGFNKSLHEYDISILKALFMIRYIQEVKGNVDNLVTLCIEGIDEDRLILRKKIEESLLRLEKETLIARSGENYYFLTNEEQDVSREIKNVELGFGDESRTLSKIIFEDIYRGDKKHRYVKTGKDFDLLRMCDLQVCGGRVERGLTISVISAFYDEYSLFGSHRCIGESTNDNGCIVIKLPDSDLLGKEIQTFLKTEKYIARKNEGNPEIKRILDERKSENRERKGRIIELVKELLGRAEYYINGWEWRADAEDPFIASNNALDYLVDNSFSKMGYIEHPSANPQGEIQSVMRHDDTAQRVFDMNIPDNNPKAAREVRDYISLCVLQSKQMVAGDIIERFAARPYGWNEWETALILAKLYCLGEIQFLFSGGILERGRVAEVITRTSNWKKVTVRQRKVVDVAHIEKARRLGQEVFGQMGSDKELPLYQFLRQQLEGWRDSINQHKTLADTGKYPGLKDIQEISRLVELLLDGQDSFEFIGRILENRDGLITAANTFADINGFYIKQRPQWDELRDAMARFEINSFDLENSEDIKTALIRMRDILAAPAPYGIIREAASLIQKVDQANDKLLADARGKASNVISTLAERFVKEAEGIKALPKDIERTSRAYTSVGERLESEESIANINRLADEAKNIFVAEMNSLVKTVANDAGGHQVREVQIVHIRSEASKPYLESDADVDEFIDNLSGRFKKAIKDGKRIRVE